MVERHVAQGERHLSSQRAIIERLGIAGLDTTDAESLLRQFQGTLAMHIAHRERLHRELDKPELT
jgi:hypothetical protein